MNLISLIQNPRRRRRVAYWTIGLLLGYAIFGFLILPLIIRAVAVKKISAQLHREVSIRSVRMNPFVLSATIRGLLIKDKDGEPFVSWDEVFVNFQLASFFGKPWVFKEVRTVNPFVRVQVNKDYTLNSSDLAEEFSTNAPSPSSAEPFALRIDRLHIAGAKASYTDLTPRTTFARVLGPIDVTLTGFRTDPDNKNPYSFSGTTDAGEKFAWSGYFFLSPLRSQGDLSLGNITLNKYAPLYDDLVRFEVKDGSIDLRGTYRFELSSSNRVASVTNAAFALHSLKISERGSETNLIELTEFAVTGASGDAVEHRGEIDSITAKGGHLWLRRDADASLNVLDASKPSDLATNAPGGILLLLRSVTNAVAMLLDSTNKWNGTIHQILLTNNSITLEDFVNSRPVRLSLDDISVSAKHISNVPGTNLIASVSLRWNTNGTFNIDTEASFSPPTANVQIALDQLELKPLDPYLESKVNAFVLGSKLSINGTLKLATPTNGLPEVSFTGDSKLNDFATIDGALGEDLLSWKSVGVSGIEAALNPPSVAIKEISINEASARMVVETNRTINLLAALRIGETNAAAANTTTRETNAVAIPPSPTIEPKTKFSVATVVFTNSQLRLTDRSVSPTVNLSIRQLNGTVSKLSSDNLGRADVDLHAKIENVGPVAITGTVNPLTTNLSADLKIAVNNMDLTPASPYAGKFAGYRIAKGKLAMDLNYKIVDRKLTAKNLIVLDQFTFGEKVESPDATKLPVKLAVAVLKDRNGKIELDVPIDGNLDDPQFHFGKVINRAIVNVITKIVTSPFAALGSLFGGKGEELSFVEFAPGSADLTPEAKAKLDSLRKGLYDRPALQLDIEGSVNPDTDREGLRALALGRQLRAKKWAALRKSERAQTTADQVTLGPDEAAQWVQTLYKLARQKGELQPETPEKVSAPETLLPLPTTTSTNTASPSHAAKVIPKGATALLRESPPAFEGSTTTIETSNRPAKNSTGTVTVPDMARALLNAIPVSTADLQTLATDRAKAIREYLLQPGNIESDRIFLVETQSAEPNPKGNRALLQLK
jgi:hypothetical protein